MSDINEPCNIKDLQFFIIISSSFDSVSQTRPDLTKPNGRT